jgi:superfamily II DNA/RNA helicase
MRGVTLFMNNTRQSSSRNRTSSNGGNRSQFSRGRSSSSFRGRPSSSSRNSGGSRGRGGRGGKMAGERIDVRRFIRPAEPVEEVVAYKPQYLFSDFDLLPEIKTTIKQRGYTSPSPIQDQAIPASLLGKDVLGIADTGTGKTAAFLLPIIQSLIQNKKQKALILAPTRELALQIEKEFRAFTTREMKIFSVSLVGGAPLGPQMRELSRGIHIAIGTPGRVKDMIQRNLLRLDSVSHIVLDEVDQMLNMGFVDEITDILNKVPEDTQKYFFSATLEPRINTLIETFLNDPTRIILKKQDASKNVEQNVVKVEQGSTKIQVLCKLLTQKEVSKTIIFAETKRDVQRLSDDLAQKGFKAGSLHGDKRHRERVRILDDFKKNSITILVATDVAARGIDVPDVSHVINYEIPRTFDTYIHRIGRTGRANKRGNALTFI